VDDREILDRVRALVDEEHTLRSELGAGEIGPDEEHARLRELEEALDQCWDLLRQRRARQGVGQDPDEATPRSTGQVEGYLQ
jgi:hypothetical protein